MSKVGFTTSVPVEILIAADKIPIDLNNVFINDNRPQQWIEEAETAGYPRNTCGWIKGLYSIALRQELESIIAVMHGDCSNTLALMETWQLKGQTIVPFAYPYDRDREYLHRSINKLAAYYQVDVGQIKAAKEKLDKVRELCRQIDELTWRHDLVSGVENHYYLVSSSDFNGDPDRFAQNMTDFIDSAVRRNPAKDRVRLAYIGVPPIFTDIYPVLEEMGARVVYNEVQRQFSMPSFTGSIEEQYLAYTYPYGVFARLEDIKEQIVLRKVDGIIHYTQTFCFRQIEDMIFRQALSLPFISLEGDKPGKVDARTRMRLETFIDMLR